MAKARPGQAWTAATRGLARGLGAALVFSFALNLLMLAVPLYSMQLYDRVLGSGHVETLVLLTLITALALAAMGAFEMVRASLLARTARPLRAEPGGAGGRGWRPARRRRRCGPARPGAAAAGPRPAPAIAALFDAPWLPLALAAIWSCIRCWRPSPAPGPSCSRLLAVAQRPAHPAPAARRQPQPARRPGLDRSHGAQGRSRAGHGHGRRPGAPRRPAARRGLADGQQRAAERGGW